MAKAPAIVLSVCCALLSVPLLAAPPNIKPGLWQMTMDASTGSTDAARMQEAMARMKAELAKMPAGQRQMIEAQMAKMGVGINATSGEAGLQVCLTAEAIKREALPVSDGYCERKVITQTATHWVMDMRCREPDMTGTAEAVFTSPQAYQVSFKGLIKEDGKSRPVDMRMRWRHAADSCGAIKPLPAATESPR
jgi:Protein of unknown function (DUF3617)